MKRYLLLASVAGCLLSAGNAWADSMDLDLEATVSIEGVCQLQPGQQDQFNFGTVAIHDGTIGDAAPLVTLGTDGSLTAETNKVTSTGVGQAYGLSAGCTVGGVTYSVTCADTSVSGDPRDSGVLCPFGTNNELAIGDISGLVLNQGSNSVFLGATLYKNGDGLITSGTHEGAAIKITMEY